MNDQPLPGLQQFDLTGKSAIITGGSKGIGFAMAAGLASAGADIMLVNRNKEEGQSAASKLSSFYKTKITSYAADVTIQEQTEAMAAFAMTAFGRIDILINNAGINIRGAIDTLELDQFKAVMDVNVNGVWLATRAVVPHMKESRYGRIINIASTLGLVGLSNRTPYSSSKGAVIQMTRALALELAPFNINVNAICPGPFLTEMNIPIATSKEAELILGATALGRWGELKEIQGAAIYLASNAASYMVGSLITVDGGWTAR